MWMQHCLRFFLPPYCTLSEAYLFVFEFLFVVECLQSGQFCIVNASAQCYTLHSYIHTALAESKFFFNLFLSLMQRCHYKLLSFHYFIVYCRSVISVYNAVPNLHFYTLRWLRGTCFVMFSDFYLPCHRLKLAMLCCRLSLRDSSVQSYPTLWNMNLQYITCSFWLELFLCAADTEKSYSFL